MAFLLGSFTSGMFGGFNDVQNAFLKGEDLKRSRMETQRQQDMMDAAEAIPTGGAQTAGVATPVPSTSQAPSNRGDGPRLADGTPDLGAVPQPAHLVNVGAITAGQLGRERGGYDAPGGGSTTAAADTATTSQNAFAGQLNRERSGYAVQGPNPGTAAASALPVSPVMTAPSNMPTYDVPMSQPGALSSGQGTPQAAVQTGPAQPPTGIGPDLSHLTNRPVGAAVGDWLHGRTAPPQYLPPGHNATPAPQQRQQISGIPTNPAASPTLANNQGGLGAQILAAMNPAAGPMPS